MNISDQILQLNYSIHYEVGSIKEIDFNVNHSLFTCTEEELILEQKSLNEILKESTRVEEQKENESRSDKTDIKKSRKRKGRPSKLDDIISYKMRKKINNTKCARTYRQKKMNVIKNLEDEVLKKHNYLPINILKNSNNLEFAKEEFGEEKLLKLQEEMEKAEEEYMKKKTEFATEKEKRQFINQISSVKYRIKKRYYIEHLVNLIN